LAQTVLGQYIPAERLTAYAQNTQTVLGQYIPASGSTAYAPKKNQKKYMASHGGIEFVLSGSTAIAAQPLSGSTALNTIFAAAIRSEC